MEDYPEMKRQILNGCVSQKLPKSGEGMIGLSSSQVTLWSFTESLLFLQVKKGEERGGSNGFIIA